MLKSIIIYGLVKIGLYGLIALGFTLLAGLVRLLNMAHGMIMLAAAYTLFILAGRVHLSLGPSVLIVIAVGILLVLMMHFGFTHRLMDAPVISIVLLTFGLGYAMQQIMLLVFGPYPISVPIGAASVDLLGVTVSRMEIAASSIGFGMVILVGLFLQKTKPGRAIRAVARNTDMAAVSGIDINHAYLGVLIISAICISLAGVLVVCIETLTPVLGWNLLTTAFIVSILAGVGSVWGVLLASAIIVYAELVTAFAISSVFKEAAAFVILIFILIFRPSGLFGKRTEEL